MKRFQKILALWLTAILALTGLALAEDTAARTAAEAAEILEESGDAAPDAEEACAPEDEAEPADLEAVPEGDAGSGEADGADADAPRPEAPVITARDARQDGDGVWLFAADAEALLFAWERADAPAYRVTITDEAGGEVFAADTDAPELAVPLDGLRAETRYAFSVRALWAAESARPAQRS